MARYVKKPIQVDAVPYKEGMEHGFDGKLLSKEGLRPYFNTKQGKVYAKKGDMIITQDDGEQYPCDIVNFKQSYIPAVDPVQRINPSTNFMRR
jgi:hypothetical protein